METQFESPKQTLECNWTWIKNKSLNKNMDHAVKLRETVRFSYRNLTQNISLTKTTSKIMTWGLSENMVKPCKTPNPLIIFISFYFMTLNNPILEGIYTWLVVYLPRPLWKIWVRQLGSWNSQLNGTNTPTVPVTTNQYNLNSYDTNGMIPPYTSYTSHKKYPISNVNPGLINP